MVRDKRLQRTDDKPVSSIGLALMVVALVVVTMGLGIAVHMSG